jgi:hypothetical protein
MAGMNAIMPERIPQLSMMRAIHLRAESFKQEIRRHLEDEVRDKEDAGAEAERGLRQTQILVHRERGKAHIDPVQIGDEVADDKKRYESLRDLGRGCGLLRDAWDRPGRITFSPIYETNRRGALPPQFTIAPLT